ncbi:acetamidase/formamidase family protein [Pseudarthrobacter sp. NPDC080039]|uniref:acetamidase/formamidase family protein n=1 Tax=unclassified Pseudarthrobacter TaxID=2647000 RepID=UPI00344B19F0
MPNLIFPLDSSRNFDDQAKIGHNRWHPETPPVATVKPADSFRVSLPGMVRRRRHPQ